MKRATTLPFFAVLAVAGAVFAGCNANDQSAPAPPGASGSIAEAQQVQAAPLPGYQVSVPELHLDAAPLVPLGLNPDGTIQVPPLSKPKELGVYTKGPMPGQNGPAIILGHVNSGGVDGAFAHLPDLKAGDTVTTTAPGGQTTKFKVYRTQVVDKAGFPTSGVYSDTKGPELRLITCGPGPLDSSGHNYLKQTIVYAKKGA